MVTILLVVQSSLLSIFSRAFAHDRIPVQYFRAHPLTTVFLLTRSKFAMAMFLSLAICLSENDTIRHASWNPIVDFVECNLIGHPNIPGWGTYFSSPFPRPLLIRACVHAEKYVWLARLARMRARLKELRTVLDMRFERANAKVKS